MNRLATAATATRIEVGAILLAFGALLSLTLTTSGLRISCFDDSAAFSGWSDPVVHYNNLALDFSIGRFYAPHKFAFLGWLQAEANDFVLQTVRILALAVGAFGAAWVTGRLLQDRVAGVIAAALFLSTLPLFYGYNSFLSNPLLPIGFGCACASAALIGAESDASQTHLALRRSLLAIALLCHEMMIVWLLLHLAIIWRAHGRPGSRWIRTLWGEGAITLAYVALYLCLRKLGAGDYDGVRPRADLIESTVALTRYTLGAWPGFEIFVDRGPDVIFALRSPPAIFEGLAGTSRPQDLALGLAAGTLAWFAVANTPANRKLPYWIFGLFLVCTALPNLPIAITEKYQIWARHGRVPYYYGFMGVFFLITLTVAAVRTLPFRGNWRPSACFAFTALLVWGVQTRNREIADLLRHHPVDASAQP